MMCEFSSFAARRPLPPFDIRVPTDSGRRGIITYSARKISRRPLRGVHMLAEHAAPNTEPAPLLPRAASWLF